MGSMKTNIDITDKIHEIQGTFHRCYTRERKDTQNIRTKFCTTMAFNSMWDINDDLKFLFSVIQETNKETLSERCT